MSRVERPHRRREHQNIRRGILVVCGGRTEYAYLASLVRRLATAVAVTVRVRAQDPLNLVAYAARVNAYQEAPFDEVWCVVDVDEFDIDATSALARQRGIELAVSNPCFELWLLLHYEECTAHLDGYREVLLRLRRHAPAYDKTNLDFRDFADGLPSAVKRAKGLDPNKNPSTGMWRLVERVMEQ